MLYHQIAEIQISIKVYCVWFRHVLLNCKPAIAEWKTRNRFRKGVSDYHTCDGFNLSFSNLAVLGWKKQKTLEVENKQTMHGKPIIIFKKCLKCRRKTVINWNLADFRRFSPQETIRLCWVFMSFYLQCSKKQIQIPYICVVYSISIHWRTGEWNACTFFIYLRAP